jgi:prepilin-type N-terminal cleavage/methylation domain-containing protein
MNTRTTPHPLIGSILPINVSGRLSFTLKHFRWRPDYKRVANHFSAGVERALHRATAGAQFKGGMPQFTEGKYILLSQLQRFKGHRCAAQRTTRNALPKSQHGFTLLELLVVVLVVLVLSALAIPQLQAALYAYRLNAAVSASTWAIQTTRYQAIMHGYPYQIALNAANNTYQVLSEPGGTAAFSNVGTAVPMGTMVIVFSPSTTLQFSPNGSVSAILGSMTYSVAYGGATKNVTVTNYGSVTAQ